ncbi:MAG TPA: M56 family metallopeptidase, partial [Clostridia bacterium]|nr:M56 family metallopeptidase [Clostridia bacterium]
MEDVFRTLLNMTYTAAAAMLFILALRLVFKVLKAPTWVCYALWGIALFRLLCPFSLESVLALLPSTEPIPQGFLTAQTPEIYT